MNLKSILALTTLAAVGTVSAAVTSANTLCRIEVNSGAKSTIVAVPLVKIGAGDNAIPVTELVLPDGLAAGDTLLHWNGTAWDAWTIDNGQWTALRVAEGNASNYATPASDTALARGEAVWVNQQTAGKFYIYGQVATSGAEAPSIAIAGGTDANPAYTMLGNPKTEDLNVNSLTFSGTPGASDRIVFAAPGTSLGWGELSYKDRSWGYDEITTETKNGRTVTKVTRKTDKTIPAGCGVWYVRKASGDLTVTL